MEEIIYKGNKIICFSSNDFEAFLESLEEKYGFRLKDCNWMTTESLSIYRYKNGKEVANV